MSNKLLVGDREIGKTTYLFNEIKKLQDDNFIILDSATEHDDKSLLKMVVRDFSNSKIIFTQNENDVVLNNININTFIKNYYNYFPYKYIVSNTNCNLCFDLSYFLENMPPIRFINGGFSARSAASSIRASAFCLVRATPSSCMISIRSYRASMLFPVITQSIFFA